MTRRARIVALVACLATFAQAPASAGPTTTTTAPTSTAAATKQGIARQAEIKDELKSLREEVSEASAEEAGLLERLDNVHDRTRVLDKRVAEVSAQVHIVEAEAAAAGEALDKVQSESVRIQLQLDEENAAVAAERQKLRRRAVAAYISNPSSNAAEMLLNARDLRDIAASAGYLETVVDLQQQSVRRYTERRDAAKALRAEVEVQKEAALQQRNLVVNRLDELQRLRNEQQAIRDELAAQEASQAQLLEEVRGRRDALEGEIAALKAESNSVSAFLQGLQASVTGPVPKGLVLSSPLANPIITSLFGPRIHPILETLRNHDGLDLGAPMGEPIRAAAAGTVVSASVRGGYGNATIIDHGGGLATLYAHQSEFAVVPGQVVKAGQVIGKVGSTGLSTGPHLHFEVRVRGVPVDPLLYLATR